MIGWTSLAFEDMNSILICCSSNQMVESVHLSGLGGLLGRGEGEKVGMGDQMTIFLYLLVPKYK